MSVSFINESQYLATRRKLYNFLLSVYKIQLVITHAAYLHIAEPHARACKQLELNLGFFLQDMGEVDVYEIRSRLKTFDSATQKASRLAIPVNKLDDIAGIRLIVGTTNEIPIVERFFTRQEYGQELTVLKRRNLARKDGYTALHLVVELHSNYQRSMYPGRVEVQIHTVFAHAFNFLSRSWKYKKPTDLPSEWDSQFVSLSEKLSELERSAALLQRQVVEVSSRRTDGMLTPHSLKALIQQEFGEDRQVDELVDECRIYSDIGYKTTGHLRALFQNEEVTELYEMIQSASTLESVSYFAKMKKSIFWQIFATRLGLPGTREFIESLISQGRKQDLSST